MKQKTKEQRKNRRETTHAFVSAQSTSETAQKWCLAERTYQIAEIRHARPDKWKKKEMKMKTTTSKQ